MLDGMTPEEAKAHAAEQQRVAKAATNIQGKPVAQWPPFEVSWDLSPASYHHALDGAKPKHVKPGELVLVWARLEDLDPVLQAYNLRTADEVWSVGDPSKAARLIVRWSEGQTMTPIWVTPTEPGKLGIVGGNHRLAIARAKGVQSLPLLVRKTELKAIRKILTFAMDKKPSR